MIKNIAINKEFFQNYIQANHRSINGFADHIGISGAQVSRILNGTRNPGSKFISSVLQNCMVAFEEAFFYDNTLPKGMESETTCQHHSVVEI